MNWYTFGKIRNLVCILFTVPWLKDNNLIRRFNFTSCVAGFCARKMSDKDLLKHCQRLNKVYDKCVKIKESACDSCKHDTQNRVRNQRKYAACSIVRKGESTGAFCIVRVKCLQRTTADAFLDLEENSQVSIAMYYTTVFVNDDYHSFQFSIIAGQVKVLEAEDLMYTANVPDAMSLDPGVVFDVVVTSFCNCFCILQENMVTLTLPKGAKLEKLTKLVASSDESTEDYKRNLMRDIQKKHNDVAVQKRSKEVTTF